MDACTHFMPQIYLLEDRIFISAPPAEAAATWAVSDLLSLPSDLGVKPEEAI